MQSALIYLEDIPLIVPLVEGEPLELPAATVAGFGTYCGAGQGIGDAIVPDTIYRLSVSPACWIHDISWQVAPATMDAFILTNMWFLQNLLSIIRHRPEGWILTLLRNYRAITYYTAVSTIGETVFRRLKTEQGAIWRV